NVIRDINNYPVWVDGAGESEIEAGKRGDAVGAVRNVLYQGKRIRQKLLAMSDVDRSQTYEFADAGTMPVQNYRATLRLTPIVDGDRTFVEWWATFDCEPDRREERVGFFRESFARWLGSVRREVDCTKCEPDRREERVGFFRESFARWLGSLRRKLDAQSAGR